MQKKSYSLEVGGKTMTAEFTDLAEQARGSVILRYGNTAVLATAVMSSRTRDDIDYFPLTVDFEERYYAAGSILGSRFMRREGRPSDAAILNGRIVDRTIRPLFPQHIRNEVQVVLTVLSLDEEDPSQVAVNAASLALGVSDIPWAGPVAAVRIGRVNGQGVINPTYKQRDEGDLDVLACGKDGTINMIEVAAKEASEEAVADAFEQAVAEHNKILAWQQQIIKEMGKEKLPSEKPQLPPALTELFESEFADKVGPAVFCGEPSKESIYALLDAWKARCAEVEELKDLKPGVLKRFLEDKVDEEIHRGAVEEGKRADNRKMDEVRPLFAQAGGMSPILHGSGIFYRGGTHVFTALTLGGPGDSQIIDTMEEADVKKRFMHHYNFPPYSAGETGRMGGINRRATGHGFLAEKALAPVIPPESEFPYTIRLVSECLASNGSTSMGSACASTLALMDGGVPIKAPVAGIAMGVMSHGGKHQVMTDIQGPEDEFGGMDFKVAGTRAGITAIQLDIKLDGIPLEVLNQALEGGKKARAHILDTIEAAIAAPRANISPRAPEILTMRVKPDQIGLVIGGGGKTINGIKDTAGVDDITIEDDGSIFITGKNGSAQMAKAMIEALVKEYKPGELYDGEVTRLMDFGAFVRFGPGKDGEGLVHVSEVAPFRINKISEAVSVGEKVRVMIKEIDEKGRVNLSIKAADPDFASRKGLTPSANPNVSRPQPSGPRPRAETSNEPAAPAPAPQPADAQPAVPAPQPAIPPLQPQPLQASAPESAPASAPAPKAAGGVDIGSILLPKKEVPGQTTASASRVNAGALLEQEVRAAQEGIPKDEPQKPAVTEHLSGIELPPSPHTDAKPAPAPVDPVLAPLQTYKGDIEKVVHDKNVSMVTIAAAEAVRRGEHQGEPVAERQIESIFSARNVIMMGAGAVLIIAAAASLVVALWHPVPQTQQGPQAPLSTIIPTDGTQTIVFAPDDPRSTLMTNLEAAKQQTALSLGLISRLWVAQPTSTAQSGNTLQTVSPQTFIATLAPDVPSELLRTIEPDYLLAVHVFDGNQPMLILKVDSYEQAYSGMLAWERTLPNDLAPLFNYTPRPHIPEEGIATTSTTTGPQITGQTDFVDKIVENHDARAIINQYGDVVLLWTFIDHSTLVIATNAASVREVISRLSTPALVPQP